MERLREAPFWGSYKMPSNLAIRRAPFVVLVNFIRKLGLQKRRKGPLEA